jgi:DNA-binding NtrC family response regulator
MEDLRPLAADFLRQLAEEGLPATTLSDEAYAALLEFDWPGNVRQLRNVLEQSVIESDSPVIGPELLRRIVSLCLAKEEPPVEGAHLEEHRPVVHEPINAEPKVWQTLADMERDHIARTLEHTFFNRSAAARLLGVTRQSLLRRMARYGLD